MTCHHCYGHGSIAVEPNSSQRFVCLDCKGTGQLPDDLTPLQGINAHLTDIIADVNRVRKACNDDEREPKLTEDEVRSKLSDISNLLDDLYNQIVGI